MASFCCSVALHSRHENWTAMINCTSGTTPSVPHEKHTDSRSCASHGWARDWGQCRGRRCLWWQLLQDRRMYSRNRGEIRSKRGMIAAGGYKLNTSHFLRICHSCKCQHSCLQGKSIEQISRARKGNRIHPVYFCHSVQRKQLLWLPIWFPLHQIPSKKEATLKGKNLLPIWGANSFFSEQTIFQKNNFTELPPWRCSHSPLTKQGDEGQWGEIY